MYLVERVTVDDAVRAAQFDLANFGAAAWPLGVWQESLALQHNYFVKVETDLGPLHPQPKLLALAGVSLGVEAEILTVAVDRAYRRRGIAKKMLRELLEQVRLRDISDVYLEVRAGDCGAQSLYTGLGFEIVGRRRNYYPDDDAYTMKLAVSDVDNRNS